MARNAASYGWTKAIFLVFSFLAVLACSRKAPAGGAAPDGSEAAAPSPLPSAAPEKPGFLCVSVGASGMGGPQDPLGSLAEAIELSRTSGIREIRLSAGAWTESVEAFHPVRISGGWKADFSSRAGRSALRAPDSAESVEGRIPRAALTARGLNAILRLDGLEISGSGQTFPAGLVLVDGAQAEASDCSISGGAGEASFGLMVIHQARLTLEDSSLGGGSGTESSALLLDGGAAYLYRCHMDAGAGTLASFGVQAYGSVFHLHSSAVSGGGADNCHAIALSDCADVLLSRSTLSGGWGKATYALVSAWSSPTLEGCVLGSEGTEKAWCIFENAGDSNPDMLSRCAFIPAKTGLYWDDNERSFNALNAAGNLVSGAKELTSPPSWGNLIWAEGRLGKKLSAPTGAPAALRRADRGHEGSSRDITGKARTEPWSIGAWELDS